MHVLRPLHLHLDFIFEFSSTEKIEITLEMHDDDAAVAFDVRKSPSLLLRLCCSGFDSNSEPTLTAPMIRMHYAA